MAKEGLLDIDHHFPLAALVTHSNYGIAAKSVNDLFSFLTEVVIDEPTHFWSVFIDFWSPGSLGTWDPGGLGTQGCRNQLQQS